MPSQLEPRRKSLAIPASIRPLSNFVVLEKSKYGEFQGKWNITH